MHRRLFYKILGIVALSLSFAACQNQESWLYRQWHNTLAHYNLYFNAEQKWMEVMQTNREAFKDDYRYTLSLFNYGNEESLKSNQGNMDEVIKKVSTMIDRHPQSKWVDDAYFLMGKAYFLKGDFHAAVDILEYVNDRYEDVEIKFKCQLWIARSLAMQNKWEEAESLARSIALSEELPHALASEANWVLGAIYAHEDKFQAAAPVLEKSLEGMALRLDRYRVHYILGQIYQELRQYPEAESHYAEVPKFNPPYAMAFQARMAQVSILSSQQNDFEKANGILSKMLKDDKNLDYLGQIHYKMGFNWYAAGLKDKALAEYRLSVAHSEKDPSQRTTSFLALGNHYFGIREFETAALYYDSANNSLDQNHPQYETIIAQNEILSDLLRHLLTVKNQDSLLKMALDPVWRDKKINEAIAREEAEKQAAEAAKLVQSNPNPATPTLPNMPGMPGNGTAFPFYTEAARTKGVQDFNRSWGPRENSDFWGIKSLKSTSSTAVNPNPDEGDSAKEDNGPDLQGVQADHKRFYKGLPLAKKDQAKALADIEESLLAAAQIYQNRLLEFPEAIRLYRELLERFPNSEYKAQVLYELIKLEKQTGDYDAADKHKRTLREEFPNSLYLKLIESPDAAPEVNEPNSANKEVIALYDQCLSAFQDQQYSVCRSVKLDADKSYAGNPYQSRFDYLYAASYAKEGDLKQAKALFEQLGEDHPGSAAAQRAEAHLRALRNLEAQEDADSSAAAAPASSGFQTWNGTDELVCLVAIPKGSNANMARAALSDFNKRNFVFEENLEVGSAMPMGSRWLIPVLNFTQSSVAQQYAAFGNGAGSFFGSKGLFEVEFVWISTPNWAWLNQKQNWEAYKEFLQP